MEKKVDSRVHNLQLLRYQKRRNTPLLCEGQSRASSLHRKKERYVNNDSNNNNAKIRLRKLCYVRMNNKSPLRRFIT